MQEQLAAVCAWVIIGTVAHVAYAVLLDWLGKEPAMPEDEREAEWGDME